MRGQRSMTAFYLETVLMVIIFAIVLAILSQVFGLARNQSSEAEQLTNAVCLAQNTAEAVSASADAEDLLQLLDEDGNASLQTKEGGAVLTAYYDLQMQPVSEKAAAKAGESCLRVETDWQPQQGQGGSYADSRISVYAGDGKTPLYTLDTGVYMREEGAR